LHITVSIAPPLDSSEVTDFSSATEFLYSGSHRLQTGVVSGTIEARRVAILRGKVFQRDNQPLSGVTITVLNHPEYGQTLSRADGQFDIAVNGGGLVTVNYVRTGYLPVQRQIETPWQDFVWLPDVVMIQQDPNVSLIDLAANTPIQVARGSVITDSDGLRQETLFFPQGTTAYMSFSNGTTQTITTMHVRATEYTVGPSGEQAMPAELPPNSAYTYAGVSNADEAVAAGADNVWFNPPIISYVENFLGFDAGVPIPMGYYDDDRGVWIAADSGLVIKILSVTDGMADLDVDGSNTPATPDALSELGVTDAERAKLAELYAVGQSLWRVPVPHFTQPYDMNLGLAALEPAPTPATPAPPEQDTEDADQQCASIIECQNQVLGETVDLVGTPFYLRYQSSRVPGYRVLDSMRIPLSGPDVSPTLNRIALTIDVAGVHHSKTFAPQPNLNYDFVWDGKDAYGRPIQGQARIIVGLDYIYPLVYQRTDRFGYSGDGAVELFVSTQRAEFRMHAEWRGSIGAWQPPASDLGGWSLNVQHTYDPHNRILNLGSGGQRSVDSVNVDIIETVAAGIGETKAVAVGPDGSIYTSSSYGIGGGTDNSVFQIDASGVITTVAGGLPMCLPRTAPCGDGGPATQARLGTADRLTVGPDGSLYIADSWLNRVRKIDPSGIITTVAGTGLFCFPDTDPTCGDGGPATQARLGMPMHVAVAPDGSLYISESYNEIGRLGRIRRVGTDGLISTVAGGGQGGDGGPATQAYLSDPWWVDVGPDGSLYIAENISGGVGPGRIRRVGPDGIITTVAGGVAGWPYPDAEGDLATKAYMPRPAAVVVGHDGSLYIAVGEHGSPTAKVRRVSPDGIITTVAGTGGAGFAGDRGPARRAQFNHPEALSFGPDGNLYIADRLNGRIRRIRSVFPGGTGSHEIAVPSEDGSQVYIFTPTGRHLRTLNALTGAMVYEFAYDDHGRLLSVTDGDGNLTTVTRDAYGNPTGVVAPFGQVTTFTRDANGYLASVANPANETIQMGYTADGLMTSYRDAGDNLHTFEYDPLGRLVKDLDPASGFKQLARVEGSGAYTVTVSTALGLATQYRVETLPTGTERHVNTYPDGLQAEFERRTDGTTFSRAPDGTTSSQVLGPDPRWGMLAPVVQQMTTTTPGGLKFNLKVARTATLADTADPFSLITQTETVSINGRPYTSTYTAATRTWVEETPAGRVVTTTIDAQGRVVYEQVAGLAPAAYSYDSRGRLITATLGSGAEARTVTFAYDSAGYLASVTDPLNRTASFEYDRAGRITRQALPDGRVISFTYDLNGNLASLAPPGRPAHAFDYTPVDLVSRYRPPDVNPGGDDTLYTYNPDRQATRITRPDGQTIGAGYDSAGRLNALTIARGVLGLTYDASTGNLASIQAPGGIGLAYAYDGSLNTGTAWSGPITGTTVYTYDNNLRLAASEVNAAGVIAYQYDSDSLLTQSGALALKRDPQTGLLLGSALGNVTDTLTYNGFGEAIGYNAAYSSTRLLDVQYTRDRLGRITAKTETIDGLTTSYRYTYDLAGRLTGVMSNGVTIATYAYDSNGNRLTYTSGSGTVNGTYDAQDRLLRYGTTTYTYTANGELLSKTNGAQTTTYQYDALGNLLAVTLPNGTQIEYLVDGQNRRVGKRVNGVLTLGLVYDDQLRPAAQLDGKGNVVSRFVYATRVNVPDYMIKGGVTYRLILDHLGSPRLVVSMATGQIVQRMDYDEFGRVLLDTNPGFQPFGFAGGLYDHDTGLVRFGARDYDAGTGRWMAKDPLRFYGRQANLYVYILNDPMNHIDPSGLSTCDVYYKLPPFSLNDWAAISTVTVTEGTAIGFIIGSGPGAGIGAGIGAVVGGIGYPVVQGLDWLQARILEKTMGIIVGPPAVHFL
jgi:RHS repeat-associated protein